MPLLGIQCSLAIFCWLVFFAIFISISLEIFVMMFDVKIFPISKKKSVLFRKKYLLISGGTFFYFKDLHFDWFNALLKVLSKHSIFIGLKHF